MTTVTMIDIAERIGASRSAVSFVLNGLARHHGISPALERKILRAAKELNYRPSLVARSLAARRTMTLGLLIPDLSLSYNPVFCQSVVNSADAGGYQVVVHQHAEDASRFGRAWRTMLGWHVDGVITLPNLGLKGSPEHELVRSSGVPVVLVDRDIGDPDLSVVVPDVMRGMQLAVERLAAMGHRRIAALCGPRELLESRQREMGFRHALSEGGLAVDERWIAYSTYGDDIPAGALTDATRMLATLPRPTAFVAVNVHRAAAILRAAQAMRLRVPADVSIILISGNYSPEDWPVRFARIHQEYLDVGQTAVRAVIERIERPQTPPRRVLITPTFREGVTLAPAPVDG